MCQFPIFITETVIQCLLVLFITNDVTRTVSVPRLNLYYKKCDTVYVLEFLLQIIMWHSLCSPLLHILYHRVSASFYSGITITVTDSHWQSSIDVFRYYSFNASSSLMIMRVSASLCLGITVPVPHFLWRSCVTVSVAHFDYRSCISASFSKRSHGELGIDKLPREVSVVCRERHKHTRQVFHRLYCGSWVGAHGKSI